MNFLKQIKKSFFEKDNNGKNRFLSGKFLGFALLAFVNVTAVAVASIAWFAQIGKESRIAMVSGDLNVDIKKITAYKYVYPFYKYSTEFIDYDNGGQVKKYIIEDHTLTYSYTENEEVITQNVDDITFSSNSATINLSSPIIGGYSSTESGVLSSTNIHYPDSDEFRYYLVGDNIFNATDNHPWSTTSAVAFANRSDVTNDSPAITTNVIISAGSTFILFDSKGAKSNACKYFKYNSISESGSPFRIIDNGERIKCLRSGIYTITHKPGILKIDLRQTADNKIDIAVINNNPLDPTKISIDYAGGVYDKSRPIDYYLPDAIYNQNTMVILDVELFFKNGSEIDLNLTVKRKDKNITRSMYDYGYSDTTHNLIGYVNENQQNLLNASDFYSFYALFTGTPYATTQSLWDGVHNLDNVNQRSKFVINREKGFDRETPCTIYTKENNDSTVISPNSSGRIYHCYIGIDYDSSYIKYFLNEKRLGKTYLLDRDFGFHFSGIQHLEGTN